MKHYHAHIYFTPAQTESAHLLAMHAKQLTELFSSVKVHDRPVGPHPTAMIEVHFDETSYVDAVLWVELHCGSFSTLIHQDTGDDIKDHTEGIRWIGPTLPLDFGFFELILSRPELRIHP